MQRRAENIFPVPAETIFIATCPWLSFCSLSPGDESVYFQRRQCGVVMKNFHCRSKELAAPERKGRKGNSVPGDWEGRREEEGA